MNSSADFFGNKSQNYKESAITQIQIVKELARLLEQNSIIPKNLWLDIGSGPAVSKELLFSNFSATPVYFDLSEKSLAASGLLNSEFAICGDMDSLPFRDNCFSGIVATSSFQWSNSLAQLLSSLKKALLPGGFFAFAIFTENTLSELRDTQSEFSIKSPVTFYENSDTISMLDNCGFQIIHNSTFSRKEFFPTGIDAIRAISTIGASFHSNKKLSPSEVKRFIRSYESRFKGDAIFNQYDVSFFIGTTGQK